MAGDLLIPPRLARTAVAWEGRAGQAWLDRLPRLVDELAEAWDLEVGPPLLPGGQISWVAPVRRRADGGDAVLKVQLPHPESAPEPLALRAWNGRGAVRLHDHDPDRGGLLLERCVPGHDLLSEEASDRTVEVGASIAARLHATPPPADVPSLASVLDGWADELEGRLAEWPVPDPGLGRLALDVFRTMPRACPHPVLLHGDLNPTNVLAARREPWLAIDPKPMLGDPAYDGARLVTQPDPNHTSDPAGTVRRRLRTMADGLGVATDALGRWCLADVVEQAASARATHDEELADRLGDLVVLLGDQLE